MIEMIESILNLDTNILIGVNSTISCFFFAFAGAFLQEVITIYKNLEYRINLHKILIGTMIGALLFLALKYYYFNDLGVIESSVINLFCGVIGFEIFLHCSSIDNLKDLANDIHQIIRNIFSLDDLLSKKKDSDKESKDKKDNDS